MYIYISHINNLNLSKNILNFIKFRKKLYTITMHFECKIEVL